MEQKKGSHKCHMHNTNAATKHLSVVSQWFGTKCCNCFFCHCMMSFIQDGTKHFKTFFSTSNMKNQMYSSVVFFSLMFIYSVHVMLCMVCRFKDFFVLTVMLFYYSVTQIFSYFLHAVIFLQTLMSCF